MPNPELCDREVLEMLATKVMDIVRKKHTTPFHKHLLVCDPTLGAIFLQQIQFHYDLNLVPKMFAKKLQMFMSSNMSGEQKVNWPK
jgi:hypothetical protein